MRKKKKAAVEQQEQRQPEEKILDVSASMQGTLRFDDPVNLRISGKFEGTLDTKGKLMLGSKADIRANITGESVSVAGNIQGNIKATQILRLESTAKLNGDIEAPNISIAEGAVLNGHVHMTKPQQADDSSSFGADWMTIDQLAEYLEVDINKVNEWTSSNMLPGTKDGDEWRFERSKVDQWIAEGKVKA